jgi:hypothetical protein
MLYFVPFVRVDTCVPEGSTGVVDDDEAAAADDCEMA